MINNFIVFLVSESLFVVFIELDIFSKIIILDGILFKLICLVFKFINSKWVLLFYGVWISLDLNLNVLFVLGWL